MAYDDVFEADWSPTAGAQPIPRMKAPRTQEEENDVFSGDWKATSPETDLTKPKPQKPWAEAGQDQEEEYTPGHPMFVTAGGLARAGIKGPGRSLVRVPAMIGGAVERIGATMAQPTPEAPEGAWDPLAPVAAALRAPNNLVGPILETTGRVVKNYFDKKADEWFGKASQPGEIPEPERIVEQGLEMLVPSLLPYMAVSTGLRILSGLGSIYTAAKVASVAERAALLAEATKIVSRIDHFAQASTAVLFGLSQGQETIDTAKNRAEELRKLGKDKEADALIRVANLASVGTGTIEALGEFFGTKYLGKLFRLDEAEVVKRGAKQLVKYFLKALGVEVSTEMGQQFGEAEVESAAGIRPVKQTQSELMKMFGYEGKMRSSLAEALDVIGPTAFMTLLTGGAAGALRRVARVAGTKSKEDPTDILTDAEELGFDPNQAKTFIDTVYGGEASVEDLRAYQKELDPKTPTFKALEHAITQLTADESELEEIDLIEEQPRPQAAREDIGTVSPDKQQQAREEDTNSIFLQAQEQIQAQAQAFEDYLVQQEQTAMALPAQQELPVQPTTATQEETFYPEEVAPTTEEGMAMTGAPDIFTADWKPTEVQKAIPVEKQKPEGKTKEEPTGTGNISGAMTFGRLNREVKQYRGTGGIASEARSKGFRPAFRDTETGENYESNFKNGQPATIHLLEGLPDQVVLMRDEYGEPIEAKASLEAGFLKGDKFFTRDEAVAAIKAAQLKPEKRPATPATVTTAATEAKAPAKDDEAIRELMGLSQDRIDAYDPTQVVSKLGDKWTYTTYQGSMHPSSFDTRKEAIAAAGRHKELKQSQFDDPNGYFDLAALKAGKALIPSIVYHGTGKQFVDFTNPSPDAGYFFTSDRDAAKSFGERVVSAKLKLSNPYEDDAQGASFYDYPIQATIDMAKEKGFDGLILRNVRDYKRGSETKKPIDIFVAFQPEQIEQTGKPPAAGEQGQKEAAKEKEAMAKGKPAAVEAKPAELTVTEQLENIKVQPKPVKFVRKETGKEITLKFKKQSALKALNDIATKKQILENIRGCLG